MAQRFQRRYRLAVLGAPPQPKPEIYTYVKTTVPGTGGWMYHGLVDPGATIAVRIESTCSSSCTWAAKLWQPPGWVTLRSHTFGTASQYLESLSEVDAGTTCVKHFVLATTPDSKITWDPVTVKNSSNAWQFWTSGVDQISSSLPYVASWQNIFWTFTTWRSGPATC
jgi:hypothetical protein